MDEDRTSRRRNAAAAVAGVAAVVVVALPMALFAKGDGKFGPGPGPDTPTRVSPDLIFPSPTSPNQIRVRVADISFRFPLASGWDISLVETGELGLKGPDRFLDSLEFGVCGAAFDDPEYVDRLRVDWTNVEDKRSRQLTTYADADQAVDAVGALTQFFRACPTEDFDDGFTRVGQVIRTDVGDEAWGVVRHFQRAGSPATGLEVIHVIRVGRAVLIDMAGNEASGGPDPAGELQDQLDAMSSAIAVPVLRMCDYSKAGCPDGITPPPRRFRRP
jgi:hypothetical protein